jgi:dolichol-phosphate mannosyltransferase
MAVTADEGSDEPLISVVVPVYNEHESLPALHEQVCGTFAGLPYRLELVLVDDGSRDGSTEMIREMAGRDPRIVGLRLSRNFGHEAAIEAGLRAATGDALIVMDADLQDSPDALPRLLDEWERGADVAYAVRRERKEGPLARLAFSAFYRMARRVMSIDLPRDAGPFCLIDRQVADVINEMREINRYFPGLRAYSGFNQVAVEIERNARLAGETKYSFTRRTAGAFNAIVSFSMLPLRLVTALGLLTAGAALLGAVWVVASSLVRSEAPAGWVSLMTVVLLISGVQLLTLGIVGEYVGKTYDEVRARPNFVVADTWRDGRAPARRRPRATRIEAGAGPSHDDPPVAAPDPSPARPGAQAH